MDDIPLPPNAPSYSPSHVTSSPESSNCIMSTPCADKVVPVLGKEKAKKRLLAFSKGISFGLKSRNNTIQSSRDNPVVENDDDDDENESELSFSSATHSSSSALNSSSVKKLNIESIMEEEKELAAHRPNLSYIPPRSASSHVMSAVPQLIVPVLPPNALIPQLLPSSSSDKTEKRSDHRYEERTSKRHFNHHHRRRHKSSSDKYADIEDIPSDWKAFKAIGLQVFEPDFPKFKRNLDREQGKLSLIESRKRTNLNIVKSGDEFIWKEYVRDPVASDCELAFRGLSPKIVQNYSEEEIQDLLWSLDSDYHSKEFPKDVNKKLKGRHSVTFCFNPRFYQTKYETRSEIHIDEEEQSRFERLLESLFKKKEEEINNSKFISGSFISKEIPRAEHRQWYKKIENFMFEKETIFPEVLKARQKEGFVPSKACSAIVLNYKESLQEVKEEGTSQGNDTLLMIEKMDTDIGKNSVVDDFTTNHHKKHKKTKKKDKSNNLADEEEEGIPDNLEEFIFSKKSQLSKSSKKKKRKKDNDGELFNKNEDYHNNKLIQDNEPINEEECPSHSKKSKKHKSEVKSDDEKRSDTKKKKKKKKRKKSMKESESDLIMDERNEDEVIKSVKKKKKHKKERKMKKSKKNSDRKDQSSPLMDEEIISDKSIGLCNIGTWEDPMKLTEISISSHCDEDVRSPSPPPSSSKSKKINSKDPRTRSLFAVAGYGYEEESSQKLNNSHGPHTPSPKSSSRGPRTPSPKSKGNWRPPSPRISPPREVDGAGGSPVSRKYRRRSRSRSYDRCSSGGGSSRHSRHSRSPSHHRRSAPHRRSSRSPRRSSHRHHRSPSPICHYDANTNNPPYHLERSVADSTISDADLPGYPSNLRQIYSYDDFHGLSQGHSPKRLSLDERLEKELGINVREVPPPQDFSVPPPGYPIRVPPPLVPSHPPPPILSHMLHPDAAIHHLPPGIIPHSLPPPPLPHKDVPEEGRLVRVGNMLQIVPEAPLQPQPISQTSSSSIPRPVMVPPPPTTPNNHVAAATAAAAAAAAAVTAALQNPPEPKEAANTAVTLMRKMEEMKKQRDRERDARREQRFAEKMERQIVEKLHEPDPTPKLEEKQVDEIKEDQEEANEAKILQEAISSVPELDDEYFASSPPSAPKSYSKNKKHDRIHYISLKPFSKKERKRQKMAAANPIFGSVNNSLGIDEVDEDEEWVPRSPVPLPDVSTCKPILMQPGFSGREKKILRYADGILPGQGSPDITDMDSPALTNSNQEQTLTTSSSTSKKRKKIRLKIISQKEPLSESPPPPPPSGSPPIQHYSQWLTNQQTILTH